MLRQLISKWGIMSIEMQAGLEGDGYAIKQGGVPDYLSDEDIPGMADIINGDVGDAGYYDDDEGSEAESQVKPVPGNKTEPGTISLDEL